MILSKKPMMLAEVKEYVKSEEENKVLHDYLKAYQKLTLDKAKELFSKIEDLKNPKIKEEHIVKIVDFLPSDAEDLNKIFIDVSLNEEETNAILGIVKNY
jgi:DNA-directed RNA polymerase subunit F